MPETPRPRSGTALSPLPCRRPRHRPRREPVHSTVPRAAPVGSARGKGHGQGAGPPCCFRGAGGHPAPALPDATYAEEHQYAVG